MKTRRFTIAAGALALGASFAGAPGTISAQSLASRISSATAPRVQFEFAGRAGVCGDGQSVLSTGSGSYYGEINIVDGVQSQPCAVGPVNTTLSCFNTKRT